MKYIKLFLVSTMIFGADTTDIIISDNDSSYIQIRKLQIDNIKLKAQIVIDQLNQEINKKSLELCKPLGITPETLNTCSLDLEKKTISIVNEKKD